MAPAGAADSAEPGSSWPPELLAPDPEPAALVAAGRAYLDAGDLDAAAEVLDLAAHLDPSSVEAHLLLARALARIRRAAPGRICDWEASPSRIEAHVRAAVALAPEVREALMTEAGPDPLRAVLERTSVRFRLWQRGPRAVRRTGPPRPVLVAGLPVLDVPVRVRRRHARELLVELAWTDPSDRDRHLDLQPDGTARAARVVRDADGTRRSLQRRGRWRLERRHLLLELPGEPAQRLILGPDGLRGPDGGLRWDPHPPDCSRPFDVWADPASEDPEG